MDLSEKAEEILETLWNNLRQQNLSSIKLAVMEIAGEDPTLQELIKAGLIELTCEGDEVRFAGDGEKEAKDTVRRHRLAERLFADVLDIRGSLMNESACRFEHLLHKGVDESICTLLGHPKFCPHGNPIPPGRCCHEAERNAERLISSLADLREGQEGRIAYIQTQEARKLQKLLAMGVLPGMPISLVRRFPSYVFQVGHTQFAVDEEIANDIYVRLPSTSTPPYRWRRRQGR